MISKNKSRFIVSLQKKKAREEEGLFVIEGDKLVREFLEAGAAVRSLVAKREFIRSLKPVSLATVGEVIEASFEELRQVSSMKTPHNALALVDIPAHELINDDMKANIWLALDSVQDPGNLGTIIRAAAWFGVGNIVCSEDCVDVYNPKVIQATMGAILHVTVHYAGLEQIFAAAVERDIPVYGTLLDGAPVYSGPLGKSGIILFGNESRGISAPLLPYITHKIKIPGAATGKPGIESLNVGMAASVVLYEFSRQNRTFSD